MRLQLSQAGQGELSHSHSWAHRRDVMRELLLPLGAQRGTDDAGESQSPRNSLNAYTLSYGPQIRGMEPAGMQKV